MKKKLLSFCLLLALSLTIKAQNPANGKVVMQAFWWDYWNTNYPAGWFNYLSEMAPRLRELGINGVWVPPNTKAGGIGDNGYGPFDNYDLGDKFQKGQSTDSDETRLKTRSGDKNEYLRMVAVMHANGIEVIQDVIFNHITNAGSLGGLGGVDPAAMDDGQTKKYKNFRYTCFETPATTETAADYLGRKGRWSKNWQNFSPNPANSDITSDLARPDFGPDISYDDGAFGLSSNATYNPAQTTRHMRNNARNWLIWYKKQTGFDGVRLDAIKHFRADVMEDFLWNIQNGAGFANGGNDMYAIGEWVDGNPGAGADTDTWVQAVQGRAGTLDFALRYGIKDMVDQLGGSYSLSNIKAKQQYNRNKIATFVNSHDTFRPNFVKTGATTTGNYLSWNTTQELSGHIEPNSPRIGAAYAIAMSVDGAPLIWIEDLFNIGYLGNRWSHHPGIASELPVFDDIANLIRCHNKLNFKAGGIKWRWEAADHLVIERSGKALIGVNDHATTPQSSTVATDFPNGTVLIDFGGSSTEKRTVSNGQVNITTPPCDGSAKRKGYSVWAPESMKAAFDADFAPASKSTTQQWELSNDLGDSHPKSLQQGGSIPASSTAYRTAGKIFVQAASPVTVTLTPTDITQSLTLVLASCNGTLGVDSVSGKGDLSLTYTPSATGWITLKARNTDASNTGQSGVLITSTYTSPQVVSTSTYPSKETCVLTGVNEEIEESFYMYPNPSNGTVNFDIYNNAEGSLKVVDMLGKEVHVEPLHISTGQTRVLNVTHLQKGVYFIRMQFNNSIVVKKLILS